MEPRGSPQTARSCCSNWLVSQASKEKWPELWVRGASSFTTRRPSGSRKSSTVSTPTKSMASATVSAMQRASRITCSGTRAGTRVTSRMWFAWTFSQSGNTCIEPSMPRATMTESSRSNGTQASRTDSCLKDCQTDARSESAVIFACPLPS